MLNNKGVIKENAYSALLNEERKTNLYVRFFCDKTYMCVPICMWVYTWIWIEKYWTDTYEMIMLGEN